MMPGIRVVNTMYERLLDALLGRGVISPNGLDVQDDETQDAREAGARYSRGNIPVQDKSFVTTNDLEREREYLKKHRIPG